MNIDAVGVLIKYIKNLSENIKFKKHSFVVTKNATYGTIFYVILR